MNIGFFFTAGYGTTAHLINWALFELAANPHIQVTLLCIHLSIFSLYIIVRSILSYIQSFVHPSIHPPTHPSSILVVFAASLIYWHLHLFIQLSVSQACTVLKTFWLLVASVVCTLMTIISSSTYHLLRVKLLSDLILRSCRSVRELLDAVVCCSIMQQTAFSGKAYL